MTKKKIYPMNISTSTIGRGRFINISNSKLEAIRQFENIWKLCILEKLILY